LTILHTNDTHAHLDNIARRATVVEQVRSSLPDNNLLLLDAGDVFSGSLYFTLYQGQADLWFMEYMGYDAMCLGNHEFDKGPEVLAEFVDNADFPVLCANFDFANEASLSGKIKPWVIIEKDGEEYGIFGLTNIETREISSPGENIIINNPLDVAEEIVAELSAKGINKIIALTHLGWENNLELAAEVEEIDIIIGDQRHTAPDDYPVVVTKENIPTLVVQAGANGEYLGRLNIVFNESGVVQSWADSRLISINEDIAEDATCAAKLAEFHPPIKELMNTVIGKTTVDLDGERENVRTGETNLGNLITDAMLDKAGTTDADIAILNSGSIRTSIPAGDVTLGQVITVLPFDNYLVAVNITGEQVVAALENGVSQVEEFAGRFPQVVGLRFTWDANAEAGSRIVSVDVKTPGGYSPIEPSTVYRVVINDFMYRGGDGYTVFQEGTDFINLDFIGYDVLAEYISDHSPLSPQIKGRIQRQLKVVAVFTTGVDEPWISRVHLALLRAETEMGITYNYTDKVSEKDFEQTLRDHADEGNDVIVADVFLSEEVARNVAKDYPEVFFVFGSSLDPAEPNVSVFDNWIHEPAYLCGMIAGKLTESGVIGVVGGYPIPEVNRLINAYAAGAREVNPDVKVEVAFIDSWFDPSKAKATALEQIAAGVDIIYAERYGVIEAAQQQGILAFGNLLDQNNLAPDTVITGPVWDVWPMVSRVLTSVRAGTLQPTDFREWSMMARRGAYLTPFHSFEETLPEEVLAMVKEREQQIQNGEFTVPVNEAVPSLD
jgi:2',3'-cyclic-nucleotide 2'-phosphodiesterase (5'-nucleotidase family)